jgi:hypothetical protein
VSGLQLHPESFRSVLVEMLYCPDGPDAIGPDGSDWSTMAYGTAFVYRIDGKERLVTARHNVTGRHWQTGGFMGDYWTEPTHLRVMLFKDRPEDWALSQPEGNSRMGGLQVLANLYLLPLIGEDWRPIWTQHPTLGPDMDVAVVPFNQPANTFVMSWEREVAPRTQPGQVPWPPQLFPGEDVFVVGYPYRLTTGPNLPLWVRGTVASDPMFGYHSDGKSYPLWLIDARTRKGQSGAPVMRYRPPGSVQVRNDRQAGSSEFPDSQLLGVYSGRTSDESDLGFVWPMDEVDEICRGGVPGTVWADTP